MYVSTLWVYNQLPSPTNSLPPTSFRIDPPERHEKPECPAEDEIPEALPKLVKLGEKRQRNDKSRTGLSCRVEPDPEVPGWTLKVTVYSLPNLQGIRNCPIS